MVQDLQKRRVREHDCAGEELDLVGSRSELPYLSRQQSHGRERCDKEVLLLRRKVQLVGLKEVPACPRFKAC